MGKELDIVTELIKLRCSWLERVRCWILGVMVLCSEPAPVCCEVPLPGAGAFPQPQHLCVSPGAKALAALGCAVPRALQLSKCSSLSWIIPGWCSVIPLLELRFQLQHDHKLWINLSTQFCAASVSFHVKFNHTCFHPGGCLGHSCGTNSASALSGLQLCTSNSAKGKEEGARLL